MLQIKKGKKWKQQKIPGRIKQKAQKKQNLRPRAAVQTAANECSLIILTWRSRTFLSGIMKSGKIDNIKICKLKLETNKPIKEIASIPIKRDSQ